MIYGLRASGISDSTVAISAHKSTAAIIRYSLLLIRDHSNGNAAKASGI